MSFVKWLANRYKNGKYNSTNSSRSSSKLVTSNGFEGSYFDERLSPSALGTDGETTLSSESAREVSNAKSPNKNGLALTRNGADAKQTQTVATSSESSQPGTRSLAEVLATAPPLTAATTAAAKKTTRHGSVGEMSSLEVFEKNLAKLSASAAGDVSLTDMMTTTSPHESCGRRHGRQLDQDGTLCPGGDPMGAELRNLEARPRRVVTMALDLNRGWQALAAEITHPDRPFEMLFSDNRALQLLNGPGVRSPSDEILKTWSTTGRNRPTVRDLYDMLVRVQQLRTASELAAALGAHGEVVSGADGDDTVLSMAFPSGGLTEAMQDMCIDAAKLQPYLEGVYKLCFDSVSEATNHFSMNSFNKIGEGNFGTVYRVVIDGELMAVKRCKDPTQSKLFFNEINTLSKLKHPNVLSLYGVAIQGDERCIITRYMTNGNLEQKLRTEVMPWLHRVRILRDVLAGLEYMHSMLVVHRDIKPANILLDEDMNALLADFGLARFKTSEKTSFTQNIAGTSLYMPLEAYQNDVTLMTDMYSFGVVLLEVFSGLRVFDNEREESLLTDHIHGKNADEVVDPRLPRPPAVVEEGLLSLGRICLAHKSVRPTAAAAKESVDRFYERIGDKAEPVVQASNENLHTI